MTGALALVAMAAALGPVDLEALFADARRGGADGALTYRAPGPVRRGLERAFFAAVVAAARAGATGTLELLAAPAAPLGFRLVVGRDGDRPVVVVLERPEARRGAGAYVFRVGEVARETFVQAPHAFSDVGSGELALALWRAADARAYGCNTVHRRGRAGLVPAAAEEAPDPGGADVAHDAESTFQMVTLAWLAAGDARSLVQLHGFSDGRAAADVVLSAATRVAAPAWLDGLRAHVAAALPAIRVARYPDDVEVLGARTNVQGRAARRAGARFLHVELSATLRRALAEDAAAREALLLAIAMVL